MEIGNRLVGAVDHRDLHGLAAENLPGNEKGREELTPRPDHQSALFDYSFINLLSSANDAKGPRIAM